MKTLNENSETFGNELVVVEIIIGYVMLLLLRLTDELLEHK